MGGSWSDHHRKKEVELRQANTWPWAAFLCCLSFHLIRTWGRGAFRMLMITPGDQHMTIWTLCCWGCVGLQCSYLPCLRDMLLSNVSSWQWCLQAVWVAWLQPFWYCSTWSAATWLGAESKRVTNGWRSTTKAGFSSYGSLTLIIFGHCLEECLRWIKYWI